MTDPRAHLLIQSLVITKPVTMAGVLEGVSRCPHCSKADPTLTRQWISEGGTRRADGGVPSKWAAYACNACGGVVTARGKPNEGLHVGHQPQIEATFPAARTVSDQLPPVAQTFLRQAIDTLHAPDAAAVMAGSAVDAMLKHLGYVKGSLYDRIDKALEDQLLTAGMAEWAHSVRLGSNRPRHADADTPHVSPDEARRSVDFAEALGNFLFVLTAQINDAKQAASADS